MKRETNWKHIEGLNVALLNYGDENKINDCLNKGDFSDLLSNKIK